MPILKVLLGDDHRIVAEALRSMLSNSFDVIGLVHNGHTLIAEVMRLRPDVVVSDIFMPELNGLDALRHLRRKGVHTRFIFLTMQADATLAAEAFRAGASGFVSKEDAGEELMAAIREAAEGRFYLTRSLGPHMIDIVMDARSSKVSGLQELSPRQREVLQLLAEGKTVKEAAAIMGISPRTVETHKYEMMDNLQIKTTVELIRWALTLNLVPSKAD